MKEKHKELLALAAELAVDPELFGRLHRQAARSVSSLSLEISNVTGAISGSILHTRLIVRSQRREVLADVTLTQLEAVTWGDALAAAGRA